MKYRNAGHFILLITFLVSLSACNQGKGKAAATGSGAGIEKEEEYNENDANITTPIKGRDDLEEEE